MNGTALNMVINNNKKGDKDMDNISFEGKIIATNDNLATREANTFECANGVLYFDNGNAIEITAPDIDKFKELVKKSGEIVDFYNNFEETVLNLEKINSIINEMSFIERWFHRRKIKRFKKYSEAIELLYNHKMDI